MVWILMFGFFVVGFMVYKEKMILECSKCGFKSPQGSKFCGSCGAEQNQGMKMLMKMLFKGSIALTVIMGVLVIVGQFLPPTEFGPPFFAIGVVLIPAGVVGSLVSFGILYFVWGCLPWRDRDKRAGKVSSLISPKDFALWALIVALFYLFYAL